MDTAAAGVDLTTIIFVAGVADCTGRIVARREFNQVGGGTHWAS